MPGGHAGRAGEEAAEQQKAGQQEAWNSVDKGYVDGLSGGHVGGLLPVAVSVER